MSDTKVSVRPYIIGPASTSFVVGDFTPASISGLVAWYSADSGVYSDAGVTLATNGQTVQQWNDKSGNNYHLKQATSGSRPTYLTAGLNSRQTISFPETSDQHMRTDTDTVLILTGTTGSGFCVGFENDFATNFRRALSYVGTGDGVDTGSTGSAAWLITGVTTGVLQPFRGGFLANGPALTASTPQRFGSIFDGVNNINYLNNDSSGSTPAAFSTAWKNPGTIVLSNSSVTGGGTIWNGNISEIVVYNTALSVGDRLSLDDYFKSHWGLS